ncbi:hypothetical protein OH77DRAFT_1419800 [Trametes cingulata]|nr:hypothetical protein OH77DRAFT_1419800 [Trametes cingulata]
MDPVASEGHRISVSAWTEEALRQVGEALERVDCSKITWWMLRDLAEFLEELVEVHMYTGLLVCSDFVITWQNILDRVKSCPDYDENDSRLGYWIWSYKSAFQELESKLQSDNTMPSSTEEPHSCAAADLASTSHAGPSGLQSVREQSEQQVSGPANSSHAVEPASLVTSSSRATAPVNSSIMPAAASRPKTSEPVQEQAGQILHSAGPSDAVGTAGLEPTSSPAIASLDSSADSASASQSPPSEHAKEQREGSTGTANLSHSIDLRQAPASSTGPPLNAPLASIATRSDTALQPPPSSPVQEAQKHSEDEKAENSADTANPAKPDHSHPEPASSALSGVLIPSPGPAGSASVSQTAPWHPLQDEANCCAPTRSDPIVPRDNPARGSASARPSSSPA